MIVFQNATFALTQLVFFKIFALNYFFAYWSLLNQVKGLYGARGIAPINELLTIISQINKKKLFLQIPTIFWFNSSDAFLKGTCIAGMIFSILIILGVFPFPLFVLLWIGYLSFVSVGSEFLSFQWDTLLLEMGFLTIFFSIQTPPPIIFVLVYWVLLFRLMFSSGIIKLLSRCPEWYYQKAMDFHYETQPLPNKVAYYAQKQPQFISKISVWGVYFFEIILPFFIFTPEYIRMIVFVLMVFFQLLIFLTGNFAFFNTLTIALCIPLLSDSQLHWILGDIRTSNLNITNEYVTIFLTIFALIFILLNFLELLSFYKGLNYLRKFSKIFGSYCLINRYGLFARMTTIRNEIIVEGSDDGVNWIPYEFQCKPGDLKASPKQIAPFQPRLDWQMWFAALSSYQSNPWLLSFVIRLLENSESVTHLLKVNPFSVKPPKYIQCQLWNYHFSDLKTKNSTTDWWVREYKGLYLPPVTLNSNSEKSKLKFIN